VNAGLHREFRTVLWLAVRDYLHEWSMSICFVLALAAILAPMLVLFGLKFGIVNNMAARLIEDPRNREIRPVGSDRFETSWFESMARRGDVAFISPRTRTIAATISLRNPHATSPQIVDAELIPSGAGDPLLTPDSGVPQDLGSVVLSASAADKLMAKPGDALDGSVARIHETRRERVHLSLTVTGIAAPGAFSRDGAFVSPDLLVALEDFRDGRAVPPLGWAGEPLVEGARAYSGFRLYAKSIYDVAGLADLLAGQGIEVRTQRADIEIVRSLDRNLSVVYWLIALVAIIGFALSLGASLWANVDRKRRELSVMRLVGFRTSGIIWFPVAQALFTGLTGWGLACLVYLALERGLNQLFASNLTVNGSVCRLLPEHFLWALGLTLGACVLASALGGYQASRIEPSEGMREL
jgi:putative ABC transport system permease protein